jgi:2-hydroxycyclohexanecarboxyl-CoA dehydrogenase
VPILSQSDHSQAFDFRGAVALVTGSGRGLGRMIAETLLNGGAAIALHDINEEAPAAFGESASLTALAEELSKRGGAKVVAVTGDISKESDVATFVKKVERRAGTDFHPGQLRRRRHRRQGRQAQSQ